MRNPNPAAASNNRHHTTTGYRSEQEELEEWQRDRAEAEYFSHIEGLPTTTHRSPQDCILIANEPISIGKSPF